MDKVAVFSNDFKPATKNPQYVVASLATGVMKIADVGDLKGLDFPNPFATVKQKVNRDTGLFTTMKADVKDPKQKQIAKSGDSSKSIGGANASAEADPQASKTSIATASTNVGSSNNASNSEVRAPSSKAKHDFKTMDQPTLLKFVTSSYREVAGDLDDKDFKEALGRNRIQILDHEGRRIGSMKPETRFIYRGDLNPPRLVKTSADRNGK